MWCVLVPESLYLIFYVLATLSKKCGSSFPSLNSFISILSEEFSHKRENGKENILPVKIISRVLHNKLNAPPKLLKVSAGVRQQNSKGSGTDHFLCNTEGQNASISVLESHLGDASRYLELGHKPLAPAHPLISSCQPETPNPTFI